MPGIDPTELARIDQSIKTALDILRHSATVEADILRILETMRKDLISKLAQADLTNWSKTRLNQLLRDSEALIASYYTQAQGVLAPTYSTVAGISAAQTATALAVTAPSRAVLESLVSNILVEGAPMKAWWAKQSTDTAFKFASAVRQGIAQSETLNQIFKRVNEVTDLANRNSIALVHTSVMQVFNDANVAVLEKNADIAPTMRYLATLDSHVCWSAETLILMADGTQKPAFLIQVGDAVIGGVTGKPCRVIDTGKRLVESSVVIYYNGKIIGRVTHDHPVLTESGWKEIGSVSLSADISERQVLCRSFRAPEEAFCGASEIRGGRGGICASQRDQEARQTCDDDTRHKSYATRSLCAGNYVNQGTLHESPARLQHDGRRGRSGWIVARNTEGDGEGVFQAVQRGCGIQGEDARNTNSYWRAAVDKVARILGIPRRTGNDKKQNEFCIMEREERRQQSTQADAGRETAHDCCSPEGLARPSAPREGERLPGSEASGTTRYESGMGRSESSENVRYHEGEVARPNIPCENGAAEAPRNICGITRTSGKEQTCCYDDTRKKSGDFGETSPVVGETEGIKVGTITGVVDDTPVEVFNFTVADDHSYVAGGIIVHNCARCAPRDGLEWDTLTHKPVGHDLAYAQPPIHVGCRCKFIPVTRLTKRADELGIGQRASTFGPVAATTTFSDFLARQSPEWQDSVLGKGRAELYRSGKITLRDLVSGRGAPLSLKQLEAKYAK